MPRYSEEFKAKVVEKMMPPNARTVADVHRETGISEPTLMPGAGSSRTGVNPCRRIPGTRSPGVAGTSSRW